MGRHIFGAKIWYVVKILYVVKIFLLSINVRTHTNKKNMSLISHKTSIFHYRNIFGNMLCLPVFPASEIDNPLCLVCVQ